MSEGDRLTLRQALDEDRLADFIGQAEARDYEAGAADRVDHVIRAAVKETPAARRTSGSRKRDGSIGSKIRRGKAAASRG